MKNIQASNKVEILLANINTKSCQEKLDIIVNTNDRVHIFVCRTKNNSLIIKMRINDDIKFYYILASHFLKEIVLKKIKNKIQFSLSTSPFKFIPQKKSSRIYITP